jgi:hypothetical protein
MVPGFGAEADQCHAGKCGANGLNHKECKMNPIDGSTWSGNWAWSLP